MFFDFFNPMYDKYEDRKRRWEPEIPQWRINTYAPRNHDEPAKTSTPDNASTVRNADTVHTDDDARMRTHVDTADNGMQGRLEKARDDGYRDGVRSVITSLLPGLSDMERAVEMMGDGDIPVSNVRVMLGKLLDCLRVNNVEQYGEPGDAFDPRIHNAIMHERGIGEDGSPNGHTIVYRVIDHGWSLNGEPIIPANVVTIDAPNTPLNAMVQSGTGTDDPDHNHGDDDGDHDNGSQCVPPINPYDEDTVNAIMGDEQLLAQLIRRISGQQ